MEDPRMKRIRICIAILLIAAFAAGAPGCASSVKAAGLMDSISPNKVAGKQADRAFIANMADFSIELFAKSIEAERNSLVSPLSVVLALAMTANGADNNTLAQMEKLLGGDIPLTELNAYLYSYAGRLPNADKSRLEIANSIWFRGDGNRLQVEAGFLQRNADYYNAAAFRSAFDARTVSDVNNWVKKSTAGMIDKIINEIDDRLMMILINAVMFDAEWQKVYTRESVRAGDFTKINGAVQNVDFMHSTETTYLEDDMATGFIKPYVGGGYSFAALLPNKGVSIGEYIASLTGEGFLHTIGSAQQTTVFASMPKFKYAYEIKMNDALISLGIPDAFSQPKADFSRMGTSADGNLFISLVLHKTFISVDELGTKAGAVTSVSMAGGGMPQEPKIVHLDRPFIYAIIDNATNLPVFIGTLMTV